MKAQASKPTLPVALLFPGQGSQYVKMLDGVKDVPEVRVGRKNRPTSGALNPNCCSVALLLVRRVSICLLGFAVPPRPCMPSSTKRNKMEESPKVKDMLSKATEILGYDLLKMCLEGPEEKLAETRYCQPAMFLRPALGAWFF